MKLVGDEQKDLASLAKNLLRLWDKEFNILSKNDTNEINSKRRKLNGNANDDIDTIEAEVKQEEEESEGTLTDGD